MMYLLKVSIVITIFLVFYKALLERESFFAANRFFFILGIIASFTLPLVPIPQLHSKQGMLDKLVSYRDTKIVPQPADLVQETTPHNHSRHAFLPVVPPPAPPAPISPPVVEKEVVPIVPVDASQDKSESQSWLIWLYAFGAGVFAINFLLQLGSVIRKILLNQDKINDEDGIIVNLKSPTDPCSFFRYIFINPESYDYETYEQIIAHEKIHAQKWHSLDLILAELAIILLWFNPVLWLLRKEMEKNIEYQTDALLLKENPEGTESYQLNLVKIAARQKPLSLTNNYNQSLIKQRILKMKAKKSNIYSYWKYAFLAPLLFTTLVIVSKPQTAQAKNHWVVENELIPQNQQGDDCWGLIRAIIFDDMDMLIEHLRKSDPNCQSAKVVEVGEEPGLKQTYKTPLVVAASLGRTAMGRILLESGANPDHRGTAEVTPLMAAAANGNIDFMRLLLDKGADINLDLENYGSAYQVAKRYGQQKVANYLLDAGSSDHSYFSHADNSFKVKGRSTYKATPKPKPTHGYKPNQSEYNVKDLFDAVRKKDIREIDRLLAQGVDINKQIYGTGSPLSLATSTGQMEIVKFLLKRGADINVNPHGVGTPLIQAIEANNTRLAKYFIQKGAKLNLESYGTGAPLTVACEKKNLEIVKYLIDMDANVNVNPFGVGTPFMNVVEAKEFDLADYLLERGAVIDMEVFGTGSALADAVSEKDYSIINYLLSRKANINSNAFGIGTPLHIAVREGDLAMVKFLMKKGANPKVNAFGIGSAIELAKSSGENQMLLLMDKESQLKLF